MTENPWARPVGTRIYRPENEEGNSSDTPVLEVEDSGLDFDEAWVKDPTSDIENTPVVLMGAHGGAGVTSLSKILGLPESGTEWPVSGSVLVVARSSYSGLQAAGLKAREWLEAEQNLGLAGVVFVADAPGREPKELREQRKFIAGAYPRSWLIPWVPQWRLRPAWAGAIPRQLTRILREISSLAERK